MPIRTFHYTYPSRGQILFRALLDTCYPRYCPVCSVRLGAEEEGICSECLLSLERYAEEVLQGFARLEGAFCPFDQLLAGYNFRKGGAMREVIHSIKFESNRALGLVMGRMLARHFALSSSDYDFIVPIVSHWRRAGRRGYHQAEILARGVSMVSGIPVATQALRRKSQSISQTDLGRQDRLQAMTGAFTLGRDKLPRGSRILLMDDVLTSGATLIAAADVLSEVTPSSLVALVLAVDEA